MDFRIPWVPNTQNVLKYVKINDSSITGWGCFFMVPSLNLKGTVARIYPEILRESNGHIRLFTNFANSRGKFPNSDSVGFQSFQSLGPGSGATKMHAPCCNPGSPELGSWNGGTPNLASWNVRALLPCLETESPVSNFEPCTL